jgi:hypothetical protein
LAVLSLSVHIPNKTFRVRFVKNSQNYDITVLYAIESPMLSTQAGNNRYSSLHFLISFLWGKDYPQASERERSFRIQHR